MHMNWASNIINVAAGEGEKMSFLLHVTAVC
jgi:hypothetical protein